MNTLEAPFFEKFSALVQSPEFSDKVLHVESGAYENFACTLCGDCCNSPWKISLHQSYYEEWFDFFNTHENPRFHEPFVKRKKPTESDYADMRRVEGTHRCIFLEPDNSCYIHAHHGEEALSSVCREYPRGHKRIQDMLSSRILLGSCEAVVDVWNQPQHFFYEWVDRSPEKKVHAKNFQLPFHLRVPQHFLWVGLCLDVLSAPAPASPLQRWLVLQEVLQDLPEDVSRLAEGHWLYLHTQTLQKLAFAFPVPPNDAEYAEAGQLLVDLLPHVHATGWLNTLMDRGERLPLLTEAEKEISHHYFKNYMQNRVLSIGLGDLFWGEVNFWEQNLALVAEVLIIQTMARYHAIQEQLPLAQHHLQRATVNVAKILSQTRQTLDNLNIKGVSMTGAQHAMRILLRFENAGL